MAPNAKIAMRVGDWKILADETLSEFELYDLKADPKEATDLKEKEAARFETMKKQLAAHNAEVEAEGPDWWKRLSPSGGNSKSAKKGE